MDDEGCQCLFVVTEEERAGGRRSGDFFRGMAKKPKRRYCSVVFREIKTYRGRQRRRRAGGRGRKRWSWRTSCLKFVYAACAAESSVCAPLARCAIWSLLHAIALLLSWKKRETVLWRSSVLHDLDYSRVCRWLVTKPRRPPAKNHVYQNRATRLIGHIIARLLSDWLKLLLSFVFERAWRWRLEKSRPKRINNQERTCMTCACEKRRSDSPRTCTVVHQSQIRCYF